jgi:hypothetical protein
MGINTIPYVICRVITSTVLERDTVAMVYGPYDHQGCAAAYKKLVAAGLGDGDARLEVRGLFATGDAFETFVPSDTPTCDTVRKFWEASA